jgi:amino acid adenylation domain-containing protein
MTSKATTWVADERSSRGSDRPAGQSFELTELQQAYWLGERTGLQLAGASAHVYVEHDVPDCDVQRLERAVRALVARHDALRACVTEDGRLHVLPDVPAHEVAVLDLRGRDPALAQRELDRVREEMTHHGPPSHRWPLFDIRLTRRSGSADRLHLGFSLLIADGHSWQILQRELHRFYHQQDAPVLPVERSETAGGAPRGIERSETAGGAPRGIDDFAACRARLGELRTGDAHARALAYWRHRIATLPGAPELPIRRSAALATRFTARTHQLGRADWLALQARARAARVTPTAALATVYADVIGTFSKGRHFCLNLLVSLRDRLGARGLVDNLTDTLLLEVADDRGPFDERARALQRRLLTDLEHAAAGGVEIIREVARRRGSAALAAMPVVFSSELAEADEELPGWTKVHERVQTSHVLIDYQVRLEAGCPVLHWETVDEAFPPGFIDDMFADCCERVLGLARRQTAWSERRRGSIPARQLARRTAINATQAPLADELLHGGFESHAARRPDAPAIVTEHRTLTYGEVLRRSRAVARWLRAHGAGAGTRVAVLMERGWEQIVAVLGTLQAGAAYLPLDVAFPAQRIAHILDASGARLVLCQRHVPIDRAAWPAGTELFTVDERSEAMGGGDPAGSTGGAGDKAPRGVDGEGAGDDSLAAAPPERLQTADDLAYVIYTSGSTGAPKGVAITHRAALNTVRDISERFAVGPTDRVLALSALSFDLSVYDIFGLLAAGGAIVLPGASGAADPAAQLALVHRFGVTVWNSVPAYLQMLVEHCATQPGAAIPSLRLIMLSGDWIPVTLPDRVRTIAPGASLISLGGATEAAIWSIYHPIEEVDPTWKSIPYGRPLRNQWFHVLDDDLDHRPDWVPGHLFIGGAGLAREYLGNEALTRAAFLHHPVSGERMYRTGDWGRYLPSGDIELLGREDGQVKVRGFRIELGEIETVLRDHPRIRDAAVLVREHQGERQLVAYLVTSLSVSEPSPAVLDAHAHAQVLDSRRRLQARVPFTRAAVVRCEGTAFAAETANLSTGGVGYVSLTALPSHLRPGTPVSVSVELGEDEGSRAELHGVIAWCHDGSGGVRFEGAREMRAVEEIVQRIIDDNQLSLDHLRQFVRARLPRYMEPAMFVLLDQLPLSANGKVDRRQLPALDVAPAPPREFAAPATAAERALVRIWEELLGRPGIGVTDDFFDLGGHSMLALRMMARIRRELGVELPMAALLDRPTVARLAELIAGAAAARATPLVPLRAQGTEPPLICVHPSGGHVMCYVDLARAVGEAQPVFGLQARPPERDTVSRGVTPWASDASCEEMAADYVAALRQTRPTGPYRLAGWSMGGIVAYEMARQLLEAGQEVTTLALLDSWVPALVGDGVGPIDMPFLFARDLAGSEHLAPLGDELAETSDEARLASVIAWARRAGLVDDLDAARMEELFRLFSRNILASLRYRPRPVAVPTLLFRTSKRAFDDFPDPARMPALGWDAVIPRALIEIEEVPGDHYSILRSPAVDRIAAALTRCLRPARRRAVS